MLKPLTLLTSLLLLRTSVQSQTTNTTRKCNGYTEFCDRQYSNVSIIGAHDSYSVASGNPAANQNYTLERQLADGVRMLQVQGHMNGDVLHLCHTTCALLDAGPFTTYLTTLSTWLSANPNEVVTLLLVNTDSILPSVWAASYTAANLTSYIYTPPSVPIAYSAWPTLGEMIDGGTRLVSFLAQGADVSSVAWLVDEFTNVWETPYDQTDNSFPCTVDRVTGTYVGKMYLINHFLDVNLTLFGTVVPVPAVQLLNTTNSLSGVGSLTTQSSLCQSNWGYKPTFTLVDYYDMPGGSEDVFRYAAALNEVTFVASATTTTTGSNTSSGSGAVQTGSLGGGGEGVRSGGWAGVVGLLGGISLLLL